ncbi:peptidoglycan DD-metalloendopeptidase family protein [Roseomonas sp. HJA6]|uniref:Peptidoglycan DD-metalloendopeptidase family protein n=1 Tax=Roseomonas alba TaxID=2846776 RepID=A0ABS7AFF6_9PROT|nr:peptidoglycan DD-metalloendopeptidase family protein [Neoroseomonas alba]MBW6400487.1 peptidoglycan DD-metalloendopeptidase family protein [Neoroseomonas alba]
MLSTSALAQQPSRESVQDARRAAEAERAAAEDAARLAREASEVERGLARQRVAMAERVQQAESVLDAAQERERRAVHAAIAARDEATRRAAALAPMLPAMRRLSLWPAETLLAVPLPPEEALRGVLVLQGIARQIRQDVEALREADREASRRARVAAAEALLVTAAREEALSSAAALDSEIAAARMREAEARQAERTADRRAQDALARASNLADMLARIERDQAREAAAQAARERAAAAQRAREERAAARAGRTPPPSEPLPTPPGRTQVASVASGARVMPVAGRVLRGFGDQGEGGAARGETIQTPAGARVVSPCGGRAVFSGPFRSYGLLLIVDCADGHHVVLAGLGRLDASTGARLLPGEPVGVMGEGEGGRDRLYLELRREGQTMDPRPWLAGARGSGG